MKYFDEANERMTREELSRLQSERLLKLVAYEYEKVPLYRKKMDEAGVKPSDIKGIADIAKLPFTEKHDLRESYPFGMFATDMKDIVRLHASSGTTGKLTVVGYTQRDVDVWSECVARGLVMAGADERSVVHVCYGYGLFTGGLGAHYGAEMIGATVVPASSGNTLRQLTLMRDFGADTIACTPSYAIYLAEQLTENGFNLNEFRLKRGLFGAEPWSEEMRREIENKLHIDAYNIYGLSEISGPGVASECSAKNGMHFEEDYFYPEIVDPDTLEPLPYGQEGELVITTLVKEGIPLIRYRTRDITSLSIEPCPCGRTTVRMGRVFGRTDDMLIIRGVNVFPSQIEAVLLKVGGGVMPHYQIIVDRVDSTDTMEIHVEISEELFSDEVKVVDAMKQKIAGLMQSMLGISAKIKLVAPNSIPRSEGKAKRIIDNRKY